MAVNFNLLMKDFADKLQIQLPVTDAEGGVRLSFDDMWVRCFYATGFVYLTSTVCTLPTEGSERLTVLKTLLQMALLKLNCTREALCMVPEGNAVVLYRQISLSDLDQTMLINVMGKFVDSLEYFNQCTACNTVREPAATMAMIKP